MESKGFMQNLWDEVLWPNTRRTAIVFMALTNLIKDAASIRIYLIHN